MGVFAVKSNDIKNAIYDFANNQTNGDNFAYISLSITFLVIFFFIFFTVKINSQYAQLLEDSRFVKFYPENTLYYQDFNNPNNFKDIKNFKFLKNANSLGYGKIYPERGTPYYLIIAKSDEDIDIPQNIPGSFLLKQDDYIFISDSETVLFDLVKRIETKQYGFFENRNVKNAIKKLPEDRDETVIIQNPFYFDSSIDNSYASIFNKLFSSCAFSIKNDDIVKISGFFTYKENNIFGAAVLNKLFDLFSPKTMTINYLNKDNLAFFVGIKNFDKLANIFYFLNKNLKNNYSDTLNAIEEDFNLTLKDEFVDYLKGNAFFYIFQSKEGLEPLVVLETKKDFSSQINKLAMFLPLPSNTLKLSEREMNSGTINVLSYKNYPKELHYTTKANLFLLGFQNIIEEYTSENKMESFVSHNDVNVFLDFKYSNASKFIHSDKYKNAVVTIDFDKNLNFNILLTPIEGK